MTESRGKVNVSVMAPPLKLMSMVPNDEAYLMQRLGKVGWKLQLRDKKKWTDIPGGRKKLVKATSEL